MTVDRRHALALAAISANVIIGVLAMREQIRLDRSAAFLVSELAGGALIGVAAVMIWRRRPENRCWWLLIAASIAWWIGNFVHHPNPDVVLFAFAFARWQDLFLAWAVLAYPDGHLRRRFDRALVGVFAVAVACRTAARLFLFVPADAAGYGTRNRFLPLADDRWWRTVEDWYGRVVTIAILAMVASVAQRWLASSRTTRQMLSPALFAGVVLALCVGWEYQAGWNATIGFDSVAILYLVRWAYGTMAMALAIGMVRLRRTRSAVVDVFSDLGHRPPPERLSAALARALGDPSLVIVTWSPASGGYVDGDGCLVELPDGTNSRAATLIERDGEPMAALVHDSALLEDPGLVNAIAAGVRLTIDNDQLQSELEQQLVEVAQSRTRIVEAGDAARRQIERDLHDGAQQRLVGLMLQIQLAKTSLPNDADAGVNDMLDRAASELGEAVKELRDLAHGIHPNVLTEFGLAAALESLARRSPLPISLDVALAREPEPMIATTAYFAIAEALTNAMKHARAESLSVAVGGTEQAMRIEITDDGIGGADISGGTGVSAIADRVATVGGAIRVASPPGGGTSIEIDLPCASS